MVNLGWLVGLGTAAAVGIGAYALWVNRSAIGGALSRGVAVNVSNPVGEYFENLFRNSENNPEVSGNDNAGPPAIVPTREPMPVNEFVPYEPNANNDYIPNSNNPADERTFSPDYTPPADQDFLPPAKMPEVPPIETNPEVMEEVEVPGYRPTGRPLNEVNTSNTGLRPGPGASTFFYVDFIGDRMDQQVSLIPEYAAELANAENVRAVYNLGTKNPLSEAAFRLFGESKGAYGV